MADRYILTDDPSRAAALASTLAGQVIDPLSGTGWTEITPAGGATSAWPSGPQRARLSVPANTVGSVGVYATLLPRGDAWSVAARVQAVGAVGGGSRFFELRVGQDGTSNYVALRINSVGALQIVRMLSGSGYTWNGNGPSTAQMQAGQLWLRIVFLAGVIIVYWGIGSGGAPPSAWTPLAPRLDDNVALVANGKVVALEVHSGSSSGEWTWDVLSLVGSTVVGLSP